MLTVSVLALMLSAPPTKDDPKLDLAKQIIGEWHLTKMAVLGTDPIVGKAGEPPLWVYIFEEGGKITLKEAREKSTGVENAIYKLDTKKSPAELDISPAKGKENPKLQGIVKVDGDTLIFCSGQIGRPRPKAYESKLADLTSLFEFMRAKKDK
jgi:uncharacterized protein (TIGR03067 family)